MISVPLRSRRQKRALAAQKFQHIIPAFPLLAAGVETLRHDPHGLPLILGIFEIATSALLIGSMIRELRALRAAAKTAHTPHAAHGVAWFDVFAAGVLLAEAAQHFHETHHWKRPVLLTAVVTLALGIFHGRIASWADDKRALKVSDAGLSIARRPFGLFRAGWGELQAIEIDDRYASILTRNGRVRRIDLHDAENADALRAALVEAQARLESLKRRP
jgi:hypothetical protein